MPREPAQARTRARKKNPSTARPRRARTSAPGRRVAPGARARGPAAADPRPVRTRAETVEAPAPVLSTRTRHELRARAHHLQPIVQVGHEGLRASVLDAVRCALRDHELIKVRLHEPEDKRAMAEALATQTHAALCGLVGHTVILYRPRPRRPSAPR